MRGLKSINSKSNMAGSFPLGYKLAANKIDSVICHKHKDGREQYLVLWKSENPKNAVVSWHNLSELATTGCMALLQEYLRSIQSPRPLSQRGQKRKSPHDGNDSSSSNSSSSDLQGYEKFNGLLGHKGGRIVAKETTGPSIHHVDARTLPDAAMLAEASSASFFNGLTQVRNTFISQLNSMFGTAVSFQNLEDKETPSLQFKWISDYVLGEGVERHADMALEGCKKCRPDMGMGRGCEYTAKCDCLEFAAPDGSRIHDPEQLLILEAWQRDEPVDTSGLPKRFPYSTTSSGLKILQSFYLNSRFVIYECNEKCRCGPNCKTRNVQHGRTVPLEIFKTDKRGFGLRCRTDLKRGQFIDKYLGELITDAEADRRESAAGPGRDSYMFWLDKHMVDQEEYGLHQEDCFVADGKAMGGPTRFINHSCDPNVRMFTVSYNKYDERIYDLAFFAIDDIPKGTELTFDYMDADPDEDEDVAAQNKEKKVKEMEQSGKKSVRCLCGAENCRGSMWVKPEEPTV